MKKNEIEPVKSDLILYQTEDGKTKIEVRLEDETVWLTQQLMADLFQTTKQNIGQHLKNIFEEGELVHDSVVKNFFTTAGDGKSYSTNFYNLDVIISVGYRIKSHVATRFRIWATQRLREYIVKGFTIDDDRLKQAGGGFYFDELLARTGTFAPRRRSSGARCWTFMPPASTIPLIPRLPSSSSPSSRIRCTGRRTGTRPPRSSMTGRMRPNQTWV